MVYQIYYGDKRPGETLFDIEIYLMYEEYMKDQEDKWMVELHCTPVVSSSVNFVRNVLRPELVDDFIRDCEEIENLRGWIWERHSNKPRTVVEATKDEINWKKYIEGRIKYFCEKYGLYLNVD